MPRLSLNRTPTSVSPQGLERPATIGGATKLNLVWLMLFSLLTLTGCQSSRVRWNLFNWQNLERVPPPSTGSLSIPGMNSTPFPTSALPTPPSTLPPSYTLPQTNGLAPGVYFNNPAVNPPNSASGQWQNANGNNISANGTISAIPGRDSTANWTAPTANIGAAGFNPNTGFNPNVATVPPLLNSNNFDPFSTDRIPSWNPSILAQSQPTANPLLVTTPMNNGSGNTQLGWWPNQSSYASQATYTGNNTIGNGAILRNMQQSVKNVFNQQPANLGGFQTTTAIDNPMILATGYQANGYPPGYPATAGLPMTASQAQLQSPSVDPQAAAQQWAQYQQQQLDLLRAQQMQQLQAQAAVNPALGVGTGQMQVLAENTTSEIAERQSRMGIRTASAMNLDPRYSGQIPQGSASVVPGSTLR